MVDDEKGLVRRAKIDDIEDMFALNAIAIAKTTTVAVKYFRLAIFPWLRGKKRFVRSNIGRGGVVSNINCSSAMASLTFVISVLSRSPAYRSVMKFCH